MFALIWIMGFCARLAPPTIVENDFKPGGPAYRLEFEEELRVVPGDDERTVWSGRFLGLEVDGDGNMYVVHGNGNFIVQLDPQGLVERQIGRPGQGPGEFEALRAFRILDSGEAIAFESANQVSTINHYDADLRFVNRQRLTRPFTIFDLQASSDGSRIIANLLQPGEKAETNRFGLLDTGLNPVQTVHQYEIPNIGQGDISKPRFWLEFIPSRLQFNARGEVAFLAFDRDNFLYSALGKRYEITKWSKDGKPMLVIRKNYKPIFQSDEEIQAIVAPVKDSLISQVPQFRHLFSAELMAKAVERSGFTSAKKPLFGLKVMEDGHILAVHDYRYQTRDAQVDIFSAEGHYLGAFTIGNDAMRHMIFRNGRAYTLETTEDEEVHLVRYRYRLVPSR